MGSGGSGRKRGAPCGPSGEEEHARERQWGTGCESGAAEEGQAACLGPAPELGERAGGEEETTHLRGHKRAASKAASLWRLF